MTATCFSLPDHALFGASLATSLGFPHAVLDVHEFPDGETRVRLDTHPLDESVILIGGGRDPNHNALPLYFAAHAARAAGASTLGLVSPYLAYMRQDSAFREGEAISALAYGRFLSSCFDWVATVDPHLHRIRSLSEIFAIPTLCVSSMPAISRWISAHIVNPVVIGPDAESRQWAESVARELQVPWTTLEKSRRGDRSVTVSPVDPALLRGRTPVVLDDIASSGRTLVEATAALRRSGSEPVTCVIVHALLAPGAEHELQVAGVQRLVSTNTIGHPTNAIDVVPLLANRLQTLLSAR